MSRYADRRLAPSRNAPPCPIGKQQAAGRQRCRIDHGPSQRQANGIVDRFADDVEIGLVFGSEGLEIVHQARKDEEKRSIEEGRSEEHTSELQSLIRISYAVFCFKKQN